MITELRHENDILTFFLDARQQPNGWYRCSCPVCEPDGKTKHLYLFLEPGKVRFNCFHGCEPVDIVSKLGLDTARLYNKTLYVSSNGHKPEAEIEDKSWTYRREDGTAYGEKVKYLKSGGGKRFSWYRVNKDGSRGPAGLSNAKKGAFGLELLPPEREQAKLENRKPLCHLMEGEEKSIRGRDEFGFVALSLPHGAQSVPEGFGEPFRGFTVIFWPDNDTAGQKTITKVGPELLRCDAEVYIVKSPKEYNDIIDLLDHGILTKANVQGFINDAEKYVLPAEQQKRESLPVVYVNTKDLTDHTDEVLKYFTEANAKDPRYFVRGGDMVRVVFRKDKDATDKLAREGRYIISLMDDYDLRHALGKNVCFRRENKTDGAKYPVPPPMDFVKDILAIKDWDLPPLRGIINMPTIKEDNSLLTDPGYDADTRLFYAPNANTIIPPIPENPSDSEVKEAIALIAGELFCNMPFKDDPSYANTLAAIMTPLLRPQYHGQAPLYVVTKPVPGAGASLISDVISCLDTGKVNINYAWPKNEEEMSKLIPTLLYEGRPIINFDNASGRINSDCLCSAVTSGTIGRRVLGKLVSVDVETSAFWGINGNNITLEGQLPRRSFLTELDPKDPQPWERPDNLFKHPGLTPWVLEERGTIISKVLTIARAYALDGKPDAPTIPTFANFGPWARYFAGLLHFMGVTGFLENKNIMYSKMDSDAPIWAALLSEILGNFPAAIQDNPNLEIVSRPIATSELVALFNENAQIAHMLPGNMSQYRGENGFPHKIGRAFASMCDRRFNVTEIDNDGKEKITGVVRVEKGQAKGRGDTVRWIIKEIKNVGLTGLGEYFSPSASRFLVIEDNKNTHSGGQIKPPKPAKPTPSTPEGNAQGVLRNVEAMSEISDYTGLDRLGILALWREHGSNQVQINDEIIKDFGTYLEKEEFLIEEVGSICEQIKEWKEGSHGDDEGNQ